MTAGTAHREITIKPGMFSTGMISGYDQTLFFSLESDHQKWEETGDPIFVRRAYGTLALMTKEGDDPFDEKNPALIRHITNEQGKSDRHVLAVRIFQVGSWVLEAMDKLFFKYRPLPSSAEFPWFTSQQLLERWGIKGDPCRLLQYISKGLPYYVISDHWMPRTLIDPKAIYVDSRRKIRVNLDSEEWINLDLEYNGWIYLVARRVTDAEIAENLKELAFAEKDLLEFEKSQRVTVQPVKIPSDSISKTLHSGRRVRARGRCPDKEITKRVQILRKAGIKDYQDLKDSQKVLNAFGALEHDKIKIPGIGGSDWLDLFRNPQRTEELKTVKEALRKNLKRR